MTPSRPRPVVSHRRGVAAAAGVVLAFAVASGALAAPDPYRPQQWNVERIGASTAWDTSAGRGQVVAIVDSGVDLRHPDLVDRFVLREDGRVLGRDLVDDDDVPQDPLGHGTMVAGIAVATHDNGLGIAGVAPQARLLPVRVLDEEGRGTSADVDEGIRWAVDNGATVVNLSLESATAGDGDSVIGGATVAAPVDAVRYAWDNGVVVVAAAGNSGNGFTDYPASSPVVLVGATDRDDQRTAFSDAGRDDLLMAPGVDIVSTWCRSAGRDRCTSDTHSYGIADGTSFAAPHVAGAVAVLMATGLEHDEAVDRLRTTARDLGESGRDDETGHGLVDLVAAMAASGPSPAPSPSPSPDSSRPTPSSTTAGADGAPSTPPDGDDTTAPDPTGTPDGDTASPPPAAGGGPSDPTPTAGDDGIVTTPDDVEASPIAVPEATDGARALWALVAVLLVVGTGTAVGRAWLTAR